MNLTELSNKIFEANKEKGFWDLRVMATNEANGNDSSEMSSFIRSTIRDQLLMLVVSELGEAVEAARKGRFCLYNAPAPEMPEDDERFQIDFRNYVKDTFEDEIADAIIRLLDLCGGLSIDIDWHVNQKLRYNSLRPRLHGKKY